MARRVPKDIKDKLDALFGKDGGEAVDELIKIARGETEIEVHEPTSIQGIYAVRKVKATIKERIEIYSLLLAYQQGRPKQQVQVEHSEKPHKYDPDKLTLEELAELERLEQMAKVPELEEGAVDADFTPAKDEEE